MLATADPSDDHREARHPEGAEHRAGRPSGRFALAALLVTAALLAACMGSSATSSGVPVLESPDATPGSSAAPSSSPGDDFDQLLAYSQCMRENGVTNFPDPRQPGAGGGGGISIGDSGIDPTSPVYKAADEVCKSLMPPPAGSTGDNQNLDPFQQMLAYAQCMRDHGVTNFPDPQQPGGSGGGGSLIGPGSGIDPNSPTFQAANEACQSLANPGLESPGSSVQP
jgi:hypothetical protein